MNSQEVTATKVDVNGLHNQYAGYELPSQILEAYKMGIGTRVYGPKEMAKLALFFQDNKISKFNEVYDFYVSLKPQRLENESDAELKNRSKFQKTIEKYKPYFYNYAVYAK
jgi:hypothetical protein